MDLNFLSVVWVSIIGLGSERGKGERNYAELVMRLPPIHLCSKRHDSPGELGFVLESLGSIIKF